jgi:hypothetical protein
MDVPSERRERGISLEFSPVNKVEPKRGGIPQRAPPKREHSRGKKSRVRWCGELERPPYQFVGLDLSPAKPSVVILRERDAMG